MLYCQVVNFLITFKQEPQIFICTSQIVQIHKLRDESYLHRKSEDLGRKEPVLFFLAHAW